MSNDITEVNMLRDFVREIYIESFHSRDGHISIHSPSGRSEAEAKSRLHAFFEENFITKNFENEDVLKFDSRSVKKNPLFDIWKMCHFKPEYLTRDFALFDLLSTEEYKNGLSDYDLKCDDSGKNRLEFYTGKQVSHKQLDLYIPSLLTDGILNVKEIFNDEGKLLKSTYTLANTKRLQDLIKNDSQILAAIQFASEVFPCGVIGSYIIDSVDKQDSPATFNFKHHFIYNTLDSEVLYTIFTAINEKRYISIKCKNGIILATPIQVRFSARDGRSYIVYHTETQNHKGFKLENLENIISIKKEKPCSNYDSYLNEFNSIKINLWGKSILSGEMKTEHVEFTIQYNDTESYILKRLQREAFSGKIENDENENKASFSFDLFDSKELVPWIRSYFGRVTNFNFENKELQQQITDEISKLYILYNSLHHFSNKNLESQEKNLTKTSSANDEHIIDEETNFFNRYYSAYYRIALKTVKAINNGDISTQDELMKYISEFKILNGKTPAKSRKYQDDFIDSTNDLYKNKNRELYTLFTNLPKDFMFPLTVIEISFLKTMINDERCKLILGESYGSLKSELEKPEYDEIYPYFDKEKYVVFDKYLNGDKLFYEDETYRNNFSFLIHAAKEQNPVYFEYVEDDIPKTKVSVPEKIEYSQKEDRFKVILNSKNRPLDIQNIKTCKYTDKQLSPKKEKEILTCKVLIDIPEGKEYARKRLFREFSPFERDCEKLDESGHILSFKFEKGDYKEIAYRLLQFGPYVHCVEPECVRDRIREKIIMQYKLTFQGAKSSLK